MCVTKNVRVNSFRWKDSLWEEYLREILKSGMCVCVQMLWEQIEGK